MTGERAFQLARAADLPPEWDALAKAFFQTRAMLAHAEAAHPCRQRYWVLARDGAPVACAVTWDAVIDLLTYRRLRSPIRVRVVGLPFSIGWPGLLGGEADLPALLQGVRAGEPGFLLGLNTPAPVPLPGIPGGTTLPTAVLRRPFSSLAAYRAELRSDYRRRFDRIRAAFASVREERLPCSAYDGEAHALYKEAFERSDAKLEFLPEPFFAGLPGSFRFTRFRRDGRLVGWHVTLLEPGRATFFMGGVDQGSRDEHRTYHNLLFSVLEQAFEAGAGEVDLGQTAEVAKTRTGAVLEDRFMFGWPRSGALRLAVLALRGLLQYRCRCPAANVFRDGP